MIRLYTDKALDEKIKNATSERVKEAMFELSTGRPMKPETEELGDIGTMNFGGMITESDYNMDWNTIEKKVETANEMRTSDGQVNSTMLSIELPIRSAKWDITPASDSNEDMKIKDFVYDNIFLNDNFTFDYFLRHALYSLQFGNFLFEKVYEYREGQYYLKKIAPRLPETIQYWNIGKDGMLESVKQNVYSNREKKYIQPVIPNEYMLIFIYEQYGQDYTGKSILRSCFRNWKIKKLLIKIDAMKHERQGLGIPDIKKTGPAKQGDAEIARKIGENLRAHEKMYAYTPEGWEIGFMDMGALKVTNPLPSIKYHNSEISSNVLCQFMDLGKTETGSYALGSILQQTFFMSLTAEAEYICQVINNSIEGRKLIRELVDYNFPNVKEYPKLSCTKVATINYKEVAEYLKFLADGFLFKPNADDEQFIRKMFDLRPLSQEELEAKKEPKVNPQVGEKHEHEYHLNEWEFWRPLTDIERGINLADIQNYLEEKSNKMIEVGDKYRTLMIDDMTKRAGVLLSQSLSFDAFREKMLKIKVPFTTQMTKDLSYELKDILKYSSAKAKTELKSLGVKLQEPIYEDEEEAKKSIDALAALSVALISKQLYSDWEGNVINQKMTGIVNTQGLKESLMGLSNTYFNKQMRFKTMEVFGIGRSVQQVKVKDEIKMVRSEVMDRNTCTACYNVDGEEFRIDGPKAHLFMRGPYQNCKGADFCRGINIPIGNE